MSYSVNEHQNCQKSKFKKVHFYEVKLKSKSLTTEGLMPLSVNFHSVPHLKDLSRHLETSSWHWNGRHYTHLKSADFYWHTLWFIVMFASDSTVCIDLGLFLGITQELMFLNQRFAEWQNLFLKIDVRIRQIFVLGIILYCKNSVDTFKSILHC